MRGLLGGGAILFFWLAAVQAEIKANLYNHSGVSDRRMAAARQEAGRILKDVDVTLSWCVVWSDEACAMAARRRFRYEYAFATRRRAIGRRPIRSGSH